ncbi:MAG TPA: UPF0280 family protein [Planctomycetota bacterium]|nr:UPF0280 family protein [Planctomycetota bacterium]
MSDTFQPRFYRRWASGGRLDDYSVRVDETDLAIRASFRMADAARELAVKYRQDLLDYAKGHPRFLTSFQPLPADDAAPEIVRLMLESGRAYDVGPMAAVAGAIAEMVGRDLLGRMKDAAGPGATGAAADPELIIENGGDCFIKTARPAVVSLYAGPNSPFADKLRLRIDSTDGPRGVCTSSGTIGHSTSFGKADAVVTLAHSAALADAAATAICNAVQEPEQVRGIIEREKKRGRLLGLVILLGKHMGAWGQLEIV